MEALRPIESVALGDRAFQSIRTAIINGDLKPGEPLRDRNLADALGISRTPVREALQRLASIGLVESQGRTGWNVVGPFTEEDVHEIFQVRRLLEPAGIDQLEREPDPVAIGKLVRFFDDYEQPIREDSLGQYFGRDHAFHELIISCTKNSRIIQFYSAMGNHINRGRRFLILSATGRADETLDEHRAVTDALAAGDFAGARRALLNHLETGEGLMAKLVRSRSAQL